MSPALARLKRRADFLRVAGFRRKWATPGLIVQAAPQKAEPGAPNTAPEGGASARHAPLRVGFTVSRKVGGAVVRNRARRRLKAAADMVFQVKGRPGFDYVVIGRREAVARPFAELIADLEAALARVHGADSRTRRRAPRTETTETEEKTTEKNA